MKKRLFLACLGGGVLLIIAGVLGYFFLGAIVKRGVEKVGPRVTKVPVTLDLCTLSLFSGSGELRGFTVGNPEGYKTPSAIKVGAVSIVVVPRSVFASRVIARSIRLNAPEITLEGDLAGNNLSTILANVRAATSTETKAPGSKERSGGSKNIQVDEFVLTGVKLNVNTSLLKGQAVTVSLPDIRLTGIGQGPEGITTADLTELVLKEILAKATQAAAARLAGGMAESVKAGAARQMERLGEGLGGLLKKK